MSIGFLYPLAWLGALTLALPLWLHLHRRHDPTVVRFSALQFLDEQAPVRRSPLWPRDWPLLLLRLLGLLLLVAAFAWPYIPQHADVLIDESCVYILDNTLSHEASQGFEQARRQVLDELSAAGVGRQVAVVELTTLPRVVAGFGDDRGEAIEKVRSLRPSFQRGSYLSAFREAAGLLHRSLGERKRIVLLGDSQENQWTEGEHVPPFLENVEVTLPPIVARSRPNLGLSKPQFQRVFLDDATLAEATVELYHAGGATQATVVFRADGRETARRVVDLTGQPETIVVSAGWPTVPAEWLRGEVSVEGEPNDLAGDDRAYFALAPVREGQVELVSGSPFLRTALTPEIMQGRWQVRLDEWSKKQTDSPDAPLAEVLCAESQYLNSPAVRARVLKYLQMGRGVVLIIDQAGPVVAGFLHELGIQAVAEPPAGKEAGLLYVATEHPIFQPFRAADFGNLAEITVTRYRRLTAPNATPLVFSAQGDPLVLEFPRTPGRLLVLAFALDRTDTNWPVHPTFIPLLDRCFEQARAQRQVPSAYLPGDSVVWPLSPDVQARELVIAPEFSANRPEDVRTAVTKGQTRFRLPDAPGLYGVRHDKRAEIENILAVNPSPDESRLVYADPAEQIARWKREPRATSTAVAPQSTALGLSRPGILRQRLWWWLLLGSLAALLIETRWLSLRKDWS